MNRLPKLYGGIENIQYQIDMLNCVLLNRKEDTMEWLIDMQKPDSYLISKSTFLSNFKLSGSKFIIEHIQNNPL